MENGNQKTNQGQKVVSLRLSTFAFFFFLSLSLCCMRKCGGVQLQRVGWCAVVVVAHEEVSLFYLIVKGKGSDKFLATQIITLCSTAFYKYLYSAIQKNRCVCL